MSTPLTAERRDELDALHRAVEVKGIRIAIFMLGYWGALLFGADKAAELWPQYFHKGQAETLGSTRARATWDKRLGQKSGHQQNVRFGSKADIRSNRNKLRLVPHSGQCHSGVADFR